MIELLPHLLGNNVVHFLSQLLYKHLAFTEGKRRNIALKRVQIFVQDKFKTLFGTPCLL